LVCHPSSELLFDDIINITNNAVQGGVNGMEEFLVKWVEEREERNKWKPKEPEPSVKGGKGRRNRVSALLLDASNRVPK
jgi:kinetochore protein Mis12/MTW1